MLRTLLIIFLIVKAGLTWSQTTGETKALKDLSRQRWSKCKEKLAKILSKDSVSVGAHYIKALYFFAGDNPDFDIDSAYANLNKAIFLYEPLQLRQRERLTKLPLDSAILRSLRQQIDSAAFARAQRLDTEEGYDYFLKHFPSSIDYGDAILLLHDAAYRIAVEADTYDAFDLFLKKYPESKHSREAQDNYDRLLFETKTSDKRLTTYRKYLEENPRSPYRRIVEEQILEISSASGEPDSLVQFIHDYRSGPAVEKARNILYHLLKDVEGKAFPESLITDSLRNIQHLNRSFLVPFFSAGLFGFMNAEGKEIIPPLTDEIDQQYLCGNIEEDVLVVRNKILARNGKPIFEGDIEEIDDPGYGFLKVTTRNGHVVVLHKSGFIILRDSLIEDAFISGRVVAIKINGSYVLHTLCGKRLMDTVWQDVKDINGVLGLKKNDQWHLLTYHQAGLIADQQPLNLTESYDDIKVWPNNFIWIKRDDKEGILDRNLNVIVPLESQTLKFHSLGFESRSSSGVRLFDLAFDESGVFQDIKVGQQWLGVKLEDEWKFFDPSKKNVLSPAFDSVSFAGTFPVGYRRDSLRVYFNSQKFLGLKKAEVSYISGKDSSSYLLVVMGNKRSLYSNQGVKMFDFNYDNIQVADKGIFNVSKKEKKGLIAENGKVLLPVTYDAIGDGDGTNIPLLRSMRFGLYNLKTKKEIVPAYDKNLKPYNENLIIAFKEGNYGMVDLKSKTVIPFEYEEIVYWNDSSAFVRKNASWQLLDIKGKEIILDQVKTFRFVNDSKKEKVIIVQQGNTFGVISTVRGIVLLLTFTDIINIGSEEDPLYFTEKHVEEADIFVVIYYDKNGKLIRRQALEPEEYDMIYCSNN